MPPFGRSWLATNPDPLLLKASFVRLIPITAPDKIIHVVHGQAKRDICWTE